MKKQLLFIIFIFYSPLFWRGAGGEVSAQNPLVKQWDKRFGGTNDEWLTSFQQTTDEGYISGGFSNSDSSGNKTQNNWGTGNDFDYWIIKIDSSGNKQWDKTFGGINDDYLFEILQTADGGYVSGGISYSDSSGDKTQPTRGGSDYWIIKMDSSGNKEWDKRFGGISSDELYSLLQTSDGGYFLAGCSYSGASGDKTQPSWGEWDYWVVKTDSLGNKQWDKRYGGANSDLLLSACLTTDGGYILGGYSYSGISGDKTQSLWGADDFWIVKIDAAGNKLWDKRFGGTIFDELYFLQQTSDAGYILGGYSNSGISGDKTQANWDTTGITYDFWIVKTDSIGNKQWDKRYGGNHYEDEFGYVRQTQDAGFLISGTSYSPVSGDKTESNLGIEQTWIVKTDSMGNKQWDKTILTTGHDEAGYAIQTKESCYTIANFTAAGIGGYKTQLNWDSTNTTNDYWIIRFCDSTLTTNIQSAITNLQSAISIYPNPANELLVISDKRPGKKDIEIYDLFGRIVFESSTDYGQSSMVNGHSSITINISKLSPGIYFLKAGNEVRKFVKE